MVTLETRKTFFLQEDFDDEWEGAFEEKADEEEDDDDDDDGDDEL